MPFGAKPFPTIHSAVTDHVLKRYSPTSQHAQPRLFSARRDRVIRRIPIPVSCWQAGKKGQGLWLFCWLVIIAAYRVSTSMRGCNFDLFQLQGDSALKRPRVQFPFSTQRSRVLQLFIRIRFAIFSRDNSILAEIVEQQHQFLSIAMGDATGSPILDSATAEQLNNAETRRLLDTINSLRDLHFSSIVDLPQIIVVGD